MEAATIIDVRKEPARLESGLTIPGSVRRLPALVDVWRHEFEGRPIILFCVHGHEISQGACDRLAESGIDARYLEGGFEAWRESGLPVAGLKEQGE
jgi:rhodanese-related sulfurtransferase